jgi:hypothetical protein
MLTNMRTSCTATQLVQKIDRIVMYMIRFTVNYSDVAIEKEIRMMKETMTYQCLFVNEL